MCVCVCVCVRVCVALISDVLGLLPQLKGILEYSADGKVTPAALSIPLASALLESSTSSYLHVHVGLVRLAAEGSLAASGWRLAAGCWLAGWLVLSTS